jgi:hypothetical protein
LVRKSGMGGILGPFGRIVDNLQKTIDTKNCALVDWPALCPVFRPVCCTACHRRVNGQI